MTNWIQVASTIVLAGAALGALYRWVVRPSYQVVTKFAQFLDDWFGEPARPGIAPARLGVLERISNLEASARVVEHEVKPNAGASMKDQISRIEEHTVPAEARPNAHDLGNASARLADGS